MGRSHARILTTIWRDPDFVATPADAQRTYLLILSQPTVSFCGVIAYTPTRWAALSPGTTAKSIARTVDELERRRFLVVDRTTEEIWIRSFVKNDGVLKGGPKILSAMWKDYEAINSSTLRRLFYEALPPDLQEGVSDTPCDTPSDTPSDDESVAPSDADGIPHRMPRGRARPLSLSLSLSLPQPQPPSATPLAADAAEPPPSVELVPTNGNPPAWQAVIGRRLAELDTTGSWDLLDPYVDAWDEIHDMVPSSTAMGNLIALTCDYVSQVTGEAPPEQDRSRIAMLVRQHGKAVLLGYSKALGTTQDETPEARFRYARGVINRFIREQEPVR